MPPGVCPFPAFPPTFSELFASVTFALFCVRLLFTDCIHFEISLNFSSILTYFLGRIFPSVYSFISDISRAFGKKSIYYIWRLGIYNIFLFFFFFRLPLQKTWLAFLFYALNLLCNFSFALFTCGLVFFVPRACEQFAMESLSFLGKIAANMGEQSIILFVFVLISFAVLMLCGPLFACVPCFALFMLN